jgi:NSS family neurotransmitter:Na+ symporter
MSDKKRDGFGSRFGALVALAGAAIGLGNLWRFPYLVGNNGGGAFILIYLGFVLLLLLPIMYAEFVIGRRSQSNVFGAIKKLAPKSWFLSIGVLSVAVTLTILSFYCVVGGWTIEYIVQSFSKELFNQDNTSLNSTFSNFITSPVRPAIMHLIFLGLTALIVAGGIKEGIEKYAKFLTPLLFVIIVILLVRSVTLTGAEEGLKFLFYPDFSKLTASSFLDALGQGFFSLSLGMGCIITYSSYVNKKENIRNMSLTTVVADTSFAILAGIAIMPAVFAFGINPTSGPSLVFITLPQIFAQLPFGQMFSVLFFIVLFVAAITSSISMLEIIVAYLSEELKMTRKAAVIATSLVIAFTGTLCSLSEGVFSNFHIFGKNLFDLFDYASNNIMLPLGGLLVVLFVGWRLKKRDVLDELTSGGAVPMKKAMFNAVMFILKFVAPIAISIVMLSGIGLLKLF